MTAASDSEAREFAAAFRSLLVSAPPLVGLPNGPESTLACLRLALLLVTDELGRYVLTVNAPAEQDPELDLEIAGLEVEQAQAVQARLGELEDVDLVAEERSFGHGSSSVLFDLLDAMDGAAADAETREVVERIGGRGWMIAEAHARARRMGR